MVIAVILALIVCLVLIPTCAFATDDVVESSDTDGQQIEQLDADTNGDIAENDTDDENAQDDNDDDEGGVPDSGDNSEVEESEDGDKESGEESEGSGEENQNTNTEGSTPLQPKIDDGFKVGFIYEGNTYEMTNLKGGEKHSLADVLAKFSIEGEIKNPTIIDNKVGVLGLENGENGWELITNSAFNEKYTLKVEVNGKEYIFTVYDDNKTEEVNTKEAIDNALKDSTVGTIKLVGDIVDFEGSIENSRSITIDLNGHTLKSKDNHTILNKGTLTIIDSSGDKTGKVEGYANSKAALVNNVNATAYLKAGTFTRTDDNSWYVIRNYGTMTIEEGVAVNMTHTGSSLITNGWVSGDSTDGSYDCGNVHTDGNAVLTINGGNFSGGMNTVKNDDYSDLTVYSGKFRNTTDVAILNWNIAAIKGGDFEVDDKFVIANGYLADNGDKGELTIDGGTFTTKNGNKLLFGYGEGSTNGKGWIKINGGLFNGTVNTNTQPYTTTFTGGYYTDSNILSLVSDMLVVKYEGLYAIGDDASDLAAYAADEGDEINVVAIDPADNKVTGIPAGVTFANNSKYSIFVNGVEVKPGETYTVPAPVAEPVEVLQPTTTKKDDTLVEAKKDNATEQTSVTVEGTTAKITVTDNKGELIAPQEVTIKSVTALESTGATEASIQLDTKLVLDLDVATIKSASTSDVVTVTNEDSVITVKSGETALVSVDVKAVLSETEQTVTVKFSENTVKVICGSTAYDIDLSDLGDVGTLTLKLENGVLKVYDKDGNLLKKIEKA